MNKRAALRRAYTATQQASVELVRLQRLLHDAGLHGTAQAVNRASQKLGWEMAYLAKHLAPVKSRA